MRLHATGWHVQGPAPLPPLCLLLSVSLPLLLSDELGEESLKGARESRESREGLKFDVKSVLVGAIRRV